MKTLLTHQDHLFGSKRREAPKDADTVNHRLLVQGGFVDQLMAGVYSYLPLGLRVLNKIVDIVREEMNALGAQELLLPALQPAEPWKETGRWTDPGPTVMFQFLGRGDREVGLGWTHEEIITPLAKKFIQSYRDLPFAVYQIQNKFRNELRAKSGLLRGREFLMKDLYSFHRSEKDLISFYDQVMHAYTKIFSRCGLDTFTTEASGGAFSKYSHEFQVPTDSGEDSIFVCGTCRYAQNREIARIKSGDACPTCGGVMTEKKAIEVGNIFQLKTRFTDPFAVTYMDETGSQQPVFMGCYGIGPSRVMGTIVEVHHDDRGILWPSSVAPFDVHLLSLRSNAEAEQLAVTLQEHDIAVLLDTRDDRSAGEKFAESELMGIPIQMIVSERGQRDGTLEVRPRVGLKQSTHIPFTDTQALMNYITHLRGAADV